MTSLAFRPAINWLGTSEMGRRIGAQDWSKHPLGPIQTWPQSLKTTIQIMLSSRYAMWMGWGPEFYFFCNDAYLPTLGIKKNWLGVSARKVWREIWVDIGPRAESVLKTGQATWDESLLLFLERSGYAEETYHTFSYSPVPDDCGGTGGMLCVVTEDTERVIGERRLAILRELGADLTGIKSEQQLFDAIPRHFSAYEKDLPFSLLYIFDADGRQARLAASHGTRAGDPIAPSTIDAESNEGVWPAQRIRSEALPIVIEDLSTRVREIPPGPWPTPPHRAMIVPIAQQGNEKPAGFLVAGISAYRPFETGYRDFFQLLAGQITAGLSSVRAYEAERKRAEALAELDRAKKIAEDALRASEEHLRIATQAGTLGVWDWDVAHNRVTWSDSLFAIHGLNPGEFGGTVEAFTELVHPDDRQLVSAAIQTAFNDGAPFETEFRILRPDGEVVWIFTNANVLRENGRVTRMIGATVDISERKRSENALRASEERIKQLLTLLPAAIYTCDAGGRITFFNRRAAELWGHEPRLGELFTGAYRLWQPDGTLLPGDETPMAAAVRRGQSVRNTELIIERPDRTRVTVSCNIEPFYDRQQRCTGAISVFQDISERKTNEQILQRRNETIQLLSETLAQLLRANEPDSIVTNLFNTIAAHVGADSYFNFMVDAQGETPQLHSWAGVPEEIIETFSPFDFAQAMCGRVAETHQAIAANDIQNSTDEKTALVRALGIQTYVCNPLMVGDNLLGTLSFASHTRKFFADDEVDFLRIVSQYTAIALDRLRSAKALRSSEDLLAAELTSMQQLHDMTTRLMAMRDLPTALHEVLDAVIEIQRADFGKVRVYNPALNGLEIVAQRGFDQSFIDRFRVVTLEDDSASGMAIRTKTRVVIEDVESDPGYAPGRGVAAMGGYRAVQATPLISRSGDLLGLLLTHFRRPRRPTERELRFVDLYARQAADFIELLHTKQELHESENRLRRQAEELEQQLIASGRLVSLGEITASMAHEFNNPLGIVLGFTEDLLSSAQPGDAIYRPLQIIEDEAKRCKRIIQDLMDYSRPRVANLSTTNIQDIVTKTLSLVENRLYKQKVKLKTNIAADLPRLHADYQQLEQVLVNFYLNALDAMPRGGDLAVSADARGANGDASVIIAVSDTGIGIEEDALARIFQPFYTAKKTRGLGLGLPICERIVKNHGGRIEVESTVGQGTTFKIILPLTQGIA